MGSAMGQLFMGTKKQWLLLTKLSAVRSSVRRQALLVKLPYSVLLKRWTSILSKGLMAFSMTCLTLVASPAKVKMVSTQWQLKVRLQSLTMQVTQSPLLRSCCVCIISWSQLRLAQQCPALQDPQQSTVAQEVTGQTSFSCQYRLPMLNGLLSRSEVIAFSNAHACMTCEKQANRVMLPVASVQFQVQPGRQTSPMGCRSCSLSTSKSVVRSVGRVYCWMEEISGMACMPYSELKRPTNSSYSSMGVPAPQTRQKWMSPELMFLVVQLETEGEVSQQQTSGCSCLSTLGRVTRNTSLYMVSTCCFCRAVRLFCQPHSCQPIHTSLLPFHRPIDGWCRILRTLSLISLAMLSRMSGELGQRAQANIRSCQMRMPAWSMVAQKSSFSNCPPPHSRIMLNRAKRASSLTRRQVCRLALGMDISGGMQLPPRMYTSYPLRLNVKEVPLKLLLSCTTDTERMPVVIELVMTYCERWLVRVSETDSRLGSPRSHVHHTQSQMLLVMVKAKSSELLTVALMVRFST